MGEELAEEAAFAIEAVSDEKLDKDTSAVQIKKLQSEVNHLTRVVSKREWQINQLIEVSSDDMDDCVPRAMSALRENARRARNT